MWGMVKIAIKPCWCWLGMLFEWCLGLTTLMKPNKKSQKPEVFGWMWIVISNHSNHSGYVVCGNDLARLVFEHVLGWAASMIWDGHGGNSCPSGPCHAVPCRLELPLECGPCSQCLVTWVRHNMTTWYNMAIKSWYSMNIYEYTWYTHLQAWIRNMPQTEMQSHWA